jgi:hypothetical protein
MGRGVRLVSRPRGLRREAVVSLDTSRAPAMLLRCGSLIRYTCVRNLYNELQLFLHFPVQGTCAGAFGPGSKYFRYVCPAAGSFYR